jgi:hypothetical protein
MGRSGSRAHFHPSYASRTPTYAGLVRFSYPRSYVADRSNPPEVAHVAPECPGSGTAPLAVAAGAEGTTGKCLFCGGRFLLGGDARLPTHVAL